MLAVRAGGSDHRFDSLPDARFSREPDSWRGTYLVPAELVAVDPEALWLEWASGARAGPARAEPRRRAAAGARRARAAGGAGRARRPGHRPRGAGRAPRAPRRGRRAGAGAGRRRGAEGGRGARAALRGAGAPAGGGRRGARRDPRGQTARRWPPRWRRPPRCVRARASGSCGCARPRWRAPATRCGWRCSRPSGRRESRCERSSRRPPKPRRPPAPSARRPTAASARPAPRGIAAARRSRPP